jgi:hypothetical protein
MGRPQTMNAAYGDFMKEVMTRITRRLDDPKYIPSKQDMEVLELMAKVQVTLQKGKPLDGTDDELPTKKDRDAALAQLEARAPEPEAPPADVGAEA